MIGADTTFLIHLLRGEKNAKQMALKLDEEPVVFTTEISVYEIISGIRETKVDIKRALNELEALLARFSVLQLERKGAISAGRIAAKLTDNGNMIGDADCLIAGILISNGCNKIITRNAEHFGRIPDLEVETY